MSATEPGPILALTQGDPAGIGPEILAELALAAVPSNRAFRPLLIAERVALEALRGVLRELPWERLLYLDAPPARADLDELDPGRVPVLDPVGARREVRPGEPGPADAAGAIAALDAGVSLASGGVADALVTAPLSKQEVARHHLPGFTGHTDYIARAAGLEAYGRDYLMAFLAPDLQVALLSTHLPLAQALERVDRQRLGEALACLARHAPGRIAVAGLNPHAGEGGLLGGEEASEIVPAVEEARGRGLDVHGPESPDSLFARTRRGEFDWVLALYHDQGLIAVKTAAFGLATNWTVGLPYLRTSVDHGTAYAIAGRGAADPHPLRCAVEATVKLLAGDLPLAGAARTVAAPGEPGR